MSAVALSIVGCTPTVGYTVNTALSIVRLHQSIGLHCSYGTIYQSRIAHLDYIIKLALLTVKSHSLSGLHDFRGATSYLSKSHYGYGLHQPNGVSYRCRIDQVGYTGYVAKPPYLRQSINNIVNALFQLLGDLLDFIRPMQRN